MARLWRINATVLSSAGTASDGDQVVGADATDRKDAAKDEGRSFCAYAIGCHPEKDADWYETARGLVGGDDFVETLPWARKLKALIDGGARIITLRMTRDSIEIVHDRAPDRTRRKLWGSLHLCERAYLC
jgi:hypothetical protein